MKSASINPIAMKKVQETNFYFSAYPLKALNQAGNSGKSFLHIHSNQKGIKKYVVSAKVLPMVNPYPEKVVFKKQEPVVKMIHQDSIEERDHGWYASYE
jgi:hypothetical protein